MFCLAGVRCLLCYIPVQMVSVTAFNIWSWRHLYPLLPGLLGSSSGCVPGLAGTAGMLGLYYPPAMQVGWTWKDIIHHLSKELECCWFFQNSVQVYTWTQLIQAPCWGMATVLLWHSSSTSTQISEISCPLSFTCALSQRGLVWLPNLVVPLPQSLLRCYVAASLLPAPVPTTSFHFNNKFQVIQWTFVIFSQRW